MDDGPAMARMPLPGGSWLTLRASRLDPDGTIAVTIDRAAPHEQLDAFCRAHGLSPREVELVELLAAGADTAAVAARLHLSPHTVQDHLKAVFAKHHRAMNVRTPDRERCRTDRGRMRRGRSTSALPALVWSRR